LEAVERESAGPSCSKAEDSNWLYQFLESRKSAKVRLEVQGIRRPEWLVKFIRLSNKYPCILIPEAKQIISSNDFYSLSFYSNILITPLDINTGDFGFEQFLGWNDVHLCGLIGRLCLAANHSNASFNFGGQKILACAIHTGQKNGLLFALSKSKKSEIYKS
jgi:hypothetical protein